MEPEFIALLALNALVLTGAFFCVRRLLDDARVREDALRSDHAAERGTRDARERALLDRIMAADWPTYKTHVMQQDAAPVRQVIDDEDEARYAAEHGLSLVEPLEPEEELSA